MMRLWGLVAALGLFTTVCAAEIRDVRLACAVTNCVLEFHFDVDRDLPSFFQTVDKAQGIYKVAFARARTALALGAYDLDGGGLLRTLDIRNEATPRGVPLLSFVFQASAVITSERNGTELKGKVFRILLPMEKSKAWRVSTLKPRGATAAEVPAVKPTAEAKAAPVPVVAPAAPKVVPPAPVVAAPAPAAVVSIPAGKATPLTELGWVRGAGQEQFHIKFPATLRSALTSEGNVFRMSFEGARISTLSLPSGGSKLVQSIGLVGTKNGGTLELRLQAGAQVFQRPGRLIIQGLAPNGPALESWSWDGSSPQGRTRRYALGGSDEDILGTPDSFASERDDKKPVSTSQVFTLQPDARELIVVEDKIDLFKNPTEASEKLASIAFGQRLQSMGLTGIFYKVRMGDQMGYVNKRRVSYPDEMSPAQAERLRVLRAEQAAMQASGPKDSLAVHFEEVLEDKISYNSFGRRDPFIDLEGPSTDGINIDGVELVGIIWESETPMVLLSDSRNAGVSYTLKEGDKIMNGKVLKITPEEVLFLIHEFGVSRRYTMTLPDRTTDKRGQR